MVIDLMTGVGDAPGQLSASHWSMTMQQAKAIFGAAIRPGDKFKVFQLKDVLLLNIYEVARGSGEFVYQINRS